MRRLFQKRRESRVDTISVYCLIFMVGIGLTLDLHQGYFNTLKQDIAIEKLVAM